MFAAVCVAGLSRNYSSSLVQLLLIQYGPTFLYFAYIFTQTFLNKNYFIVEPFSLKQYYWYYFSRKSWLLFSMGWSDSHFCLIALIISVCLVYILSFYLFSLSMHFRLILSYSLSAFPTLVHLFVFFFCLTVLSVWAPFPCSVILPDSVAFIFMIIQRHHWTAKSLWLSFLFLFHSPPLSLPLFSVRLSLLQLVYLIPSGFILLDVIKCNSQFPYFFLWSLSIRSWLAAGEM